MIRARPLVGGLAAGSALLLLHACAIDNSPPPISPAVVAAGASSHVDAQELALGRSLYVARCAECHALPQVAAHPDARWRKLVRQMGNRSGLDAQQEEAVLAYVLAARATL